MYLAYTYLITNKITNEYYYGYRCRNIALKRTPEEDFWIHYFTSSKRVKTLIEKYSKDSFDACILLKDENYEKCYFHEQELILQNIKDPLCLNTYCRQNGTWSFAGRSHLPSTKAAISNIMAGRTGHNKGKPSPRRGKKSSLETREKISKSLSGKNNPNYGKKPSAKTKEKMSMARRGKDNPMFGKAPPNKGVTMSQEQKDKISLSQKLRHLNKKNPHNEQ